MISLLPRRAGYDVLPSGQSQSEKPSGFGMARWMRSRRNAYIVRAVILIVPLLGLGYLFSVVSEGWYPRRQIARTYAADWRWWCNPDAPTQFAYRGKFDLWRYETVQPLDPEHEAWPYAQNTLPSLADGDGLAPVGVYVGVMSMDKGGQRRRRIRETYGQHPASRRNGTEGVRVVFVMGQPREEYRDEVYAEAQNHGDMLILPINENMNRGKTQTFLEWSAQHARVPDCRYELGPQGWGPVCVGERLPDYVMKADDDSFINLGELERRLRILPRTKAYWGLMMAGDRAGRHFGAYDYMSGQGYVLSYDLVQYVASSRLSRWVRWGDEDQLVGNSLRFHPEMNKIVWAWDRCWVYDHPRKQYPLSHGFLTPGLVASYDPWSRASSPLALVQAEGERSSTVTPADRPYEPPLPDLPWPQQVEALIEESPLSFLNRHNLASDQVVDAEMVREAWERRPSAEERYRDRGRGGTVLVHQVKTDEAWMEAAEALLGPGR